MEESVVNFSADRLPSSKKEIDWYWRQKIHNNFDLSQISINERKVDFYLPSDYFELSDDVADKLSLIGRRYGFFSQPVSMTDVELSIFGDISADTQIGVLLGRIKHLRPTADVYGIFARYKYIEKSVYCGITICFVDKDTGEEMETAVFEISEDEDAYILPIAINEEALDYYTPDDLARLVYWLGNFWIGVQYELNNRPEEIRIVEQRGPITANQEAEFRREKRPILIKRVIHVDTNGNEIEYGPASSGRKYSIPVWGVRGHPRKLPDGRVTYVHPYRKGKERKNPDALASKEYQFIEDKIDDDVE